MKDLLVSFLQNKSGLSQRIENERSLQLELGWLFRNAGFNVRFGVSCVVNSDPRQTRRQKRDIDLLVSDGEHHLAMELKVPLAGRVPESMYDFCADIAFMEAVISSKIADEGVCLIVTDNHQFWSGSKKDGIYAPFRQIEQALTGIIEKPTGVNKDAIFLAGHYSPQWSNLKNIKLLSNARFVLIEIA